MTPRLALLGDPPGDGSGFREEAPGDPEIFSASPVPMVVVDRTSYEVLTINDAAAAVFGGTCAGSAGVGLAGLLTGGERGELRGQLAPFDPAAAGSPERRVVRHTTADGSTRFFELGSVEVDWCGRQALCVVMCDATEKTRLDSRLSRLLDASPDLVCTIARSSHLQDVNAASAKILGFRPEEIIGRPFYELVHPADRQRSIMEAGRLFEGGETSVVFEGRVLHESGQFRWILWSATYSGVDDLIHCVGRDITDRKNLELQLARSTLYDPTTGLANRVLMIDRIQSAATSFLESGALFAALVVRVERLDFVAAALGGDASDIAVSNVADRILRLVSRRGTAGRVGVDRFAVLLSATTEPEATGIAMQLRQELTEPIDVGGEDVSLNVTVGVVSAQPGMSTNGETILQDASVAADRASSTGQKIETFDLSYRQALRRRLKLESELRRAIDNDEFEMLYQPVVNLADGSLTKLEALLRWEHPQKGSLSPDEFIEVAEDAGLIVPIGKWVVRHVAAQIRVWRELTGDADVKVAINVAMRQLTDGTFVATVTDSLRREGIPGSSLVIELTERAYMIGDDRIHDAVLALRLLGCELAIDDFGTGYSSLSCLKHLPVNVIKIDKTFVDGVTDDATDRALIAGIISFAHALGLVVIAEGVETAEQLNELDALGCDLAQGFLIARPMPALEASNVCFGLGRVWVPGATA